MFQKMLQKLFYHLATPSQLAISNQRKHSSGAQQMMSHPFEAKK